MSDDFDVNEPLQRLEEMGRLVQKLPEGYQRVVRSRQDEITKVLMKSGLDPADPLHRRGFALGLAMVGHPWAERGEVGTTMLATLKPTVEGHFGE